ncbi:MAG: hypothetical protein ACRDN0_31465 [Trebonia sp.]
MYSRTSPGTAADADCESEGEGEGDADGEGGAGDAETEIEGDGDAGPPDEGVIPPGRPDGAAGGVSSAALSTGMPEPAPAFLTTTFAPNQATLTAMTVPAAQAARPASTRIMSAIMPQMTPRHTYGSDYGSRAHRRG